MAIKNIGFEIVKLPLCSVWIKLWDTYNPEAEKCLNLQQHSCSCQSDIFPPRWCAQCKASFTYNDWDVDGEESLSKTDFFAAPIAMFTHVCSGWEALLSFMSLQGWAMLSDLSCEKHLKWSVYSTNGNVVLVDLWVVSTCPVYIQREIRKAH